MSASGTIAREQENVLNDKIVAENISLIYQIKNKDEKVNSFVAIDNVTLRVREGEFLTIVGPSGCGKSTFLDVVAGLAKKDHGKVLIDGVEVTKPSLDRGIVMQGYALFPWLTVKRNVEFGLDIKGVSKEQKEKIGREYIELVGLSGFENRYPHELSGGMKQRIAIARALAYDPKVLLMDEPFAAIDEQTKESLHLELLRIWEKTHKTIIFVTHSIEEAVFLSDRVAVMSKNPGTIKQIVDVSLPRPRNDAVKSSPQFSILRHRIWKLLHNQTERKDPVKENKGMESVDYGQLSQEEIASLGSGI